MSSSFRTEQEEFWAGSFGEEYLQRNNSTHLLSCKTALFSKVFRRLGKINSIMEFGSNIGLNLRAIRQLLPEVKLAAIEINATAVKELKKWGEVDVTEGSILDFHPQQTVDFAFTSGVLIHINPDFLPHVYDRLYQSSNKYISVIEYYNPTPVTVTYRGCEDKLFKRDFAGELLDRFSDLSLVDYGFVYRRDPNFPQDDPTWFVLEKNGHQG